ncbi:MAG: uroporphyrinogen decarboxylase family protein [Candidatus Bathyarchaeia archaeon]
MRASMDVAERVYLTLKGEVADRVPWLIYSNHLPRGGFERKMRNMGLGLDIRCSVCKSYTPNVKIESKTVGNYTYVVYRTPVGEVYSKYRTGLTFQFRGQGSWMVEHPIKKVEDIDVIKFIVEDTVYESQYDVYEQLEEELEGDGIVTVNGDYTPLMKIIVSFMGFRNFVLMQMKHMDKINELIEALDKKYMDMYSIIAKSSARIVRIGDNIDGKMISPKLFEKYCLPYYNKYAEILKNSGKYIISHMDGRLRTLKDLIAKTRLDAIEAFTPPPMGDLPVAEARKAWGNKVIWMNFPEEVFLRSREEIVQYTKNLLKEMAPGFGYIISVTEDVHPAHFKKGLEAITRTIWDNGSLPIRIE